MDDFIDETIALVQKAVTEHKRQFFGALIMSDGIYDIYLFAERHSKGSESDHDLKRPCFIEAKDFASEED